MVPYKSFFRVGIVILGGILSTTPPIVAKEFVDHGQVTYQTFVSDGGFFSCSFFGAGTGLPGGVQMDGTYKERTSDFSSEQLAGIMRAVNTLEKTFVFATNPNGAPVRQAQLTFAISTALGTSVSAAAAPIFSFSHGGLEPPRTTWLESVLVDERQGRKQP